MEQIVKINKLLKKYQDHKVLDIDELELYSDKIYVILGENGAGKSTLLKIITGNLLPTSGTVCCDTEFIYLPQKPFVFDLSVKHNLSIVQKDRNQVEEVIECLGLKHVASSRAVTLSGGEMQRLALARVLCNPHKLIILDEPTTSMDILGSRNVEDALINYKVKNHCCILITTHDIALAKRLGAEVLFMQHGHIVEHGHFQTVFFESQNESVKEFMKYYHL